MSKEDVRERGFWWHWQNLKEDRPKAWLHGRAWLMHRPRGEMGIEWCAPACDAKIRFTVGGHHQLQISLSCWLFALYFTFEQLSWLRQWKICEDWQGKEMSLSFYEWTLWWNFWTNEHEWNTKTPKWRDGCFHIDDFFLGKRDYSKVEQVPLPVLIPLPEKDYEGTLTFYTQTWKRPRWPFAKQHQGGTIEIEGGIPVPGKGENSWDCDDDAFTSISSPSTTIAGAIIHTINFINQRRERYGGKDWLPKEVVS
jgi:hypothetical protein